MATRTEQREETRARIVDAAVAAFAEQGFEASSTRDIAARAGVTQGLVTYHFTSKDDLWRASADQIFGDLGINLPARRRPPASVPDDGPRAAIMAYVRFAARRPELFHFMVDAGRSNGERMQWLVDTHLAPVFAQVSEFARAAFPSTRNKLAPHVYYALAGAASLFFAVAPECEALTGLDPASNAAIERHAEFIASLFLSE
jgi:TetR/AcrR family transcriptional regulator